MSSSPRPTTRRQFLTRSLGAGTATLIAAHSCGAVDRSALSITTDSSAKSLPWYRRTLRWGQTNLTEIDPTHYDLAWWRSYWKQTHVQGIITNAGGIVSYYPSDVPFHYPAEHLGGRDLFGEILRAAREDGLVVLARMDCSRAHRDLYEAHPDWFSIDPAGQPIRRDDHYFGCLNGPYYREHIPAILREVARRYTPEGFTDNSWIGLGRGMICHCRHCREGFRAASGHALPGAKNWNDSAYRSWIRWSYAQRLELWDLFNRVTREAGGPHCVWSGMNSGSLAVQSSTFRDIRAIARRAEILMLDHQGRGEIGGFQENSDCGKLLHGVLGWDKLIPEATALYLTRSPRFRLAAKPEPEVRLWALAGMAAGLQPWWHHVAAYHEDRRMYRTAGPLLRWHRDHEQYLVNRVPIAQVGVVWSQQNLDFFGRDEPEVVEAPRRGFTEALIRARIPYLPVHADDLARDASQFDILVLPNLGAMSKEQVEAVRGFVANGGGLVATGETSVADEWGDPLPDFALADLFGAHLPHPLGNDTEARRRLAATETLHTYLRISPEMRAAIDGPRKNSEPAAIGRRHDVLRGFEETDLLPYGGVLTPLRLSPGADAPLTFVPPFPISPPETAWMRTSRTDIPGLVLSTAASGARVAFLPADLDRRFAREHLPDHGDLLANLVRWATRAPSPLRVEGPGLLDCHLYRQGSRRILHLLNLTNPGAWRHPVEEFHAVGPLSVAIHSPEPAAQRASEARLCQANRTVPVRRDSEWLHFEIPSVLDHEVAVIG